MKKKIRLIVMTMSISLASAVLSYAQVAKVWDKTFGGNNQDMLNAITPTSDGGFLLGGFSESGISVDKTEPLKGFSDYWIVKIDSTGNKTWDKSFGRPGLTNELTAIQPTDDDGFLLGGRSGYTTALGSEYDYWVVKIDKDGKKLWDKTFGGIDKSFLEAAGDELTSIQPTLDGGFLLGGSSNANISKEKTENSKGEYDYWVVKIDADGNKLWDKTFGGNDRDMLNAITLTSDGGFLLGGVSYSDISGDKSEPNKGGRNADYWVVKINAAGNKLWDKTFGGNSRDELNAITSTPDGGFLLGGFAGSGVSGDKSEPNRGINFDYWVVKINAAGNKLWDKTFGGSMSDELHYMQPTKDGGFLLGGFSESNISGEKSESSKGDTDYWLVKIDAAGNKLWDKAFGGNGEDYLSSCIRPVNGEFLLGGSSYSDISGDKSEARRGMSYDYWVVKIKEEPIIPKPAFSVYPTIVKMARVVNIDVSDMTYLPATVEIYKVVPELEVVIRQTIASSRERVDVSKLPAGFYPVIITDVKGGKYRTKIQIL